jgi:alcohol dehydrogenase
MQPFEFELRTRFIFGKGSLDQLGDQASDLGFARTLLVGDPGIVACGLMARAISHLQARGIHVTPFDDFSANPDTAMVEAGRITAEASQVDSIIGLGGGSSMDCAKGVNFLLTNGGNIQDYWGFDKAKTPLLPMIAIPTTAGTGSESQCYALISDKDTNVKMACGAPSASFRLALLDPELTLSQPTDVTAATGYDAIAHAVETFVTKQRCSISQLFSREAWRLLINNYERVLTRPTDIESRSAMQLGACYAGVAIEKSMLGATHACANPLTARYGINHGTAISVLLPHVVRWNASTVSSDYLEMLALVGESTKGDTPGSLLASLLERLARAAKLPASLKDLRVPQEELGGLAEEAAAQWTGKFNPRSFNKDGAMEIYKCAF